MRILIYFVESVKIATNALRSYKLRSILTTLGIVIGVTTVITIVALIQGLNKSFERQISAIGTDTLFIDKYPWIITSNTEFFSYRNRRNIPVNYAFRIKELSSLSKAVAPTLYSRQTAKYKGRSSEGVLIIGTNADYLVTSNTLPEIGRFLSDTDVEHRRSVCVLGWDVYQALFPNSDPIGKKIKLGGKKFKVVGVIEKKGAMFGNSMDTNVCIPIGVFQSTFGVRWRSCDIEIKINSPELMDDAEIELTGIMRRLRGLKPGEDNDFNINKQSMLMDTYKRLTNTLWAVAIGVGSISLLVGGIGIMNILLVSVTERTREIGVRKALGARNHDVLLQFLIESMVICSIGVIIGILFAIGIAKLVAATTPIPAAITLWVVFLGVGFVITIGVFFGIYPASKAARLNPIDALRYE
ncbi:ABC transporter permease [candidate division KSB1 bacterium]|nr:ABC transporter permease [candidate division KSB1 bacterium]